jgi:hypothetical protein
MLLEVQWGSLGTFYFGEKTFNDGPISAEGRIQDISQIRATVAAEGLGTVATLTVSMLDNDEIMLDRMTSVPLAGQIVQLHRAFIGTGESIVIFRGRAAGPVVWNEDHKTFEFDVVTTSETDTIPYTPEEDDFAKLSDEAAGQTWPMCFGTPKGVPCTQISFPPEAVLVEDLEQDATEFEIDIQAGEFTENVQITLNVNGEHITGTLVDTTFTISERNVAHYLIHSGPNALLSDAEKVDPRFGAWSLSDEQLVGKFVVLSTLGETRGLVNKCLYQRGNITRHQHPWFYERPVDIGLEAQVFGIHPDSTVWTHSQGSFVYEVGKTTKYVANELESDEVHTVKAYRTVNGHRSLARIPSAWYTVNLSASGLGVPDGRTPTTITFDLPLAYRNSGWDQTVYVSLTSSVGSNTADVIKFIADTYSEATTKVAAFATVQGYLEKYPSHFYINSEADALDHAAEIAFQARCSLFETGSELSIVYLSREPTDIDVNAQLNDGNLREGMVQLGETESDELSTVIRGLWKKKGSDDEDRVVRAELNTDLYGRNERDINFFIYQTRSLVKKSVTFWSQRLGIPWRLVRMTTFMNAISVELLDVVKFEGTDYNLPVDLLCRPQEIEDNSDANNITLLLWTPVPAGSRVPSSLAYLDDSGDTKPADPTFKDGSDLTEVEEGSTTTEPIDSADRETYVAKATADEVDGVFDADFYEGTTATGTPTGSGTVQNVSNTAVKEGDVLPVHTTETGARYAAQGGGSPAFICEAAADQSGTIFLGDIYSGGDDSALLEEDIPVRNAGDGEVKEGDIMVCWTVSDGTFVVDFRAAVSGSAATVRVGTKISGSTYNAKLGGDDIVLEIVNAPTSDTVPADTILVALLDTLGNWVAQVPVWL